MLPGVLDVTPHFPCLLLSGPHRRLSMTGSIRVARFIKIGPFELGNDLMRESSPCAHCDAMSYADHRNDEDITQFFVV
jgi:hypothetical protein